MEVQKNGIISTAFLDKCAIAWRFIQLPIIRTYEPHYTVIHICLSPTTQYSGVEYVRPKIGWTEKK